MKLAIKGHPTRGEEVIALLEMLGGINVDNLDGDDFYYYYYITDDKEIDAVVFKYSDDEACIFSLEEFENKFPYKVRDKVQHKGATSCGTVYVVEHTRWTNNHIEYEIRPLYDYNHTGLVTLYAKDLQPYKEKTMEEKIQAYEITGEFCANEVAIEFDPSKFEMIERNGKYFVVKKQPQYPKTYEECCEVLMGKTNFQDFGLVLTKFSTTLYEEDSISPEPPHITLINNFYKLLICRDAYWKIAGEWMGLGKLWKPDFTGEPQNKYSIYNHRDYIQKGVLRFANIILAFPTEEMRDTFYENFKELIEIVKELL